MEASIIKRKKKLTLNNINAKQWRDLRLDAVIVFQANWHIVPQSKAGESKFF